MLLVRRIWLWIIVVTTLAICASTVRAQNWTPFGPSNVRYDLELFAPADLSTYADWPRPKEGFFFQYERLYWTISQPRRTEIGVEGATKRGFFGGSWTDPDFQEANPPVLNPADNPWEFIQDYNNTIDTGFLKAEQTWGNRFELGFMEDNKGWLVSIMNLQDQGQVEDVDGAIVVFDDPQDLLLGFIDADLDGFDDDLNVTGPINTFNRVPLVLGRPRGDANENQIIGPPPVDDATPEAYAGFTDFGDMVSIAPVFDTMVVRNTASMAGVEVMRSHRYPPAHRGGVWEFMYGVRWLQLKDSFEVNATGGFGTVGNVNVVPDTSFWNSTVYNNMVGPQLGLRFNFSQARFTINSEFRFMGGINFQQVNLDGELASGLIPVTETDETEGADERTNAPLRLTRTGFNHWDYEETFAPVGELRVGVQYQLTRAVSVLAQYNGVLGGGVSRGSRRIHYHLPDLRINDDNESEAFFSNGVSLGINCNR